MIDWPAWAAATPVLLVAVAWVTVPGLAATYALGLRGIGAWGLAPVVSIGSVAGGAVVAGQLGLPWSPAVAVGPAVVLALLAVGARLLPAARRRRGGPAGGASRPGADGARHALAATAGMAVAATIGTLTVASAIGTPSRLSQTYDAVFHYNAVMEILSDGTASSLQLGRLTTPTADIAFYPAAWHDLVSLVVLTTGASVPVAATAAVTALACVVWPLSCLVLVWVICGPVPAAVALAPVVAVGFVSFPWSLMGFGVLWPNLTGLCLTPAVLAVVVALCRLGPPVDLGRGTAAVLLPVGAGTLGLAHPNALFSLALLAVFPVAWALGRAARRRLRGGERIVPAGLVLGLAAGIAAAVWFVLTSPVFDDVREFDWAAYQDPGRAVGEVALGATNNRPAAWALAVVVLLGLGAACLRPAFRWLVPAHLLSGALFVLASAQETEFAAAVTALWYNDSYRLAAVLPVTAAPLAVLGLLAVGLLVSRAWPVRARPPSAAAGALVAGLLVLVASGGMYSARNAEFVRSSYPGPQAESDLLDPDEAEFYERIGGLIEPGAVVAQNPWSGSALLWPLTGHEVLFPHLTGDWSADQVLLARRLRDVQDDWRVCAAADRLGVRYLLAGTADFWLGDSRARRYPGLEAPAPDSGFRLVAAAPDADESALYELTACDGAPGNRPG
ncbi:DUF6541 family protein [Pseudonocardia sp.]|uniref:DUF6541 family protein n=1 Tax=Pseudonocardia sp. TaxID=60912 RepID=UPI002631AECC|nr:DUF6541 family protein [Pseudonocardia sp.]